MCCEALEDQVAEDFEAMHKVWGAGGDASDSGGVSKDNIFLAERGAMPCRCNCPVDTLAWLN